MATEYKLSYTASEIDKRLGMVSTLSEEIANKADVGEVNQILEQKIDNPSTGEVGQILEIESIDDTGKPLTYKAVDKPDSDSINCDELLYGKTLLSYNGTEYDKFPIELEHYSWNHFVGTKRLAKLVENATLFTTENATAHEANGVGFNGGWYLFQWVQNTSGTTTDMEDAKGSCEIQGKLMYWRYGINYNLTSQSDAFTIAKQGDVISRTVAGDTITASGGVGICNVAKKDASTSIYSIATYYHDGKHIPTTREISIIATDYTTDPNGNLSIGEPVMWTITKDGTTYDMDDNVLGTEYGGHVNCQIYCDYSTSGYNYYMAVVRPNKGISIIKSTDCTNWTWVVDVDIPVENTAYIETALAFFGDRWYAAVRCKDGRLWVAKLMTDYSINWNFFMPDCGSKPMFITCSKSLLLVCAPTSRYSCRIYRFTSSTSSLSNSKYPSKIEAIADITYNACNYPFFVSERDNGRPAQSSYSGIPTMLCLGTNNYVTNRQGCSYFVMKLPVNSSIQYPNEAVNEMAKDVELGTLTFTGAVETTYDGSGDVTVKIPNSSSSGGMTWESVVNETLESEVTAFTEVSFETARTINRIRAYMEIIGTATNGESEYNMQMVINGTVIGSSQGSVVTKTDGTKKYVFFDIDISASGTFSKGFAQAGNGDTWSSQTCNQFNETIKSTTEVSSIIVRSRQGWGTLGVGSKLILDIC